MLDRAIADYTSALRVSPQSPKLLLLRGGAFSEKGEHDRAVVDYTQAIRLKPDSAAYNARGNANKARGNFDAAIGVFSEAIRLGGVAYAYVLGRASAYSMKGDHARAMEDLAQAIQLDPETFNDATARIFLSAGKAEQALVAANNAIAKAPNYPFSYEGRAVVYEALGRKEEAIADYRNALIVGSRFSGAYFQTSRDALKRLGVNP